MRKTVLEPSTHSESCPEYRQSANAENGGLVNDSAWPCTCKAKAKQAEEIANA